MKTTRIADLFQVRHRFMRSVHLERDFHDPEAVRGYVVTATARTGIERLVGGLAPRSGQRAWRITGDYGTGKSSFALAISHLLSGEHRSFTVDLRRAVDFRELTGKRPRLLPILITGSRSPVSVSLLNALGRALEQTCTRGKRPQLIERINAVADAGAGGSNVDDAAVKLLREAAQYIQGKEKGTGLLIVLDELGKFLEYAALYPERQDVYCLQMLAEAASRSGDAPILVVGLLHQGFSAYAEQLSHALQKEWEKVAGRFDEILFSQPLEQTAELVAEAMNVRVNRLSEQTVKHLRRDMAQVVDLGWYGVGAARRGMIERAAPLYPLHPTVVPVLVRLFTRFGQNERSLFSFLLSDEPFALQSFADQPLATDRVYRIHDLYDYARRAFGHRLAVQSYRSHWHQIESVVESFPVDHEFELRILKTVAVLNLVDSPALLPSEEAVSLAVGGASSEVAGRTKAALRELQRGKAVLYFRGSAGGYCLWPHTSVNLERAYHEATQAVPLPQRVATIIKGDLETRPLVARRHYIETGNLRHFTVEYAAVEGLPSVQSSEHDGADGMILVALCETDEERAGAIQFAQSPAIGEREDLLVAIPQPLKGLASLLVEVQRWEWISQNLPELHHDTFAQEEVSRQLAVARQVLQKRIRTYVGLRQFGESTDLWWFYHGRQAAVRGGRELLEKLSSICDHLYDKAPQIRNELVNRHSLSSAAAAARLRLIGRILSAPAEPLLGMDPQKKPPEMSMYLSILKAAKLHRDQKDVWEIVEPKAADDPVRVRPVLQHILELLMREHGRRVRMTDLFAELRRAPFGLRDGVAPLLLAVFTVLHEQDVAFYEKGGFVRQVTSQEFHRLIKAPETFEVQYCRIGGVRTVVFEKLLQVLNPKSKVVGKPDVLDVVRPLCVFAAQLPQYTHKTTMLSPEGLAVREALLTAEEPATLLFTELPKACGSEAFESEESPSLSRVSRFVEKLRMTLDELRTAYPELLGRMKAELLTDFHRPGDFDQVRVALATAADKVLALVSEPRVKAFCLRLSDRVLAEQEWFESLGSFVCSKPPSKWADSDAAHFREELGRLARQFQRVESVAFSSVSRSGQAQGMRIAITCQDGTEVDQVVYLDGVDEVKAAPLEAAIGKLLTEEGRLGLVAAIRAIRARLRSPSPHDAPN